MKITNKHKDGLWLKFDLDILSGFIAYIRLYYGVKKIFREANLQKSYTIRSIIRPDFDIIDKYLRQECGIILGMLGNPLNELG